MKDCRIESTDTLEDVCYKVCTALSKLGIEVILSGGSAATVYAPSAYRSSNADFIGEFRGMDHEGTNPEPTGL